MNTRTIQHPGVQIHQIDMSQYTDSIIVNNAYVMGFADKGPIYEYQWITTRSEFLKIYGTPQDEAEKYLYYAVMSILDNGGTPVVARMPYDNKQCKAYKGIAIRYAGVTSEYPTDDNPDDDVVYGWSNSPNKAGDYFPNFNDGTGGVIALKGTNAIPLSATIKVPLSGIANLLGQYDTPDEILYKLHHNTSKSMYLTGSVDDIKVINYLWALNPVSKDEIVQYIPSAIRDLIETNGYLPEEERIKISGYLTGITKSIEELSGYQTSSYSKNSDISGMIDKINNTLSTSYLSTTITYSQKELLQHFTSFKSKVVYDVNVPEETFYKSSGAILAPSAINEEFSLKYEIPLDFSQELRAHGSYQSETPNSGWIFDSKCLYDGSIKKNYKGIVVRYKVTLSEGQNYPSSGYFFNYDGRFENTKAKVKTVTTKYINALTIQYASLFRKLQGAAADDNPYLNAYNALNSGNILTAVTTYPDGFDLSKNPGRQLNNKIQPYLTTAMDCLSSTSLSSYSCDLDNMKILADSQIIGYFSQLKRDTDIIDKQFSQISGMINRIEVVNTSSLVVLDDIEFMMQQGAYKQSELTGLNTITAYLTYHTDILSRTSTITSGDLHYQNKNRTDGIKFKSKNDWFNPNYNLYSVYQMIFSRYSNLATECKTTGDDIYATKLYNKVAVDDLKYYNVYPSALNIPSDACVSLINECSGIINETIKDLDDTELSQLFIYGDTSGAISSFCDIYNSPKFFNLGASVDSTDKRGQINQAIIDAKLLNYSEVGYEYGIFLDSKEITISNQQYDDLVVAQRFTNGQDQLDSDAMEDIDFKYRSDLRAANFVIIDKNKSIAQGEGSNEGIFTTIVDPYDAMKIQRLLGNPYTQSELLNNSPYDKMSDYKYWTEQNKVQWRLAVADQIENVNLIQHVYNADNILIGQNITGKRYKNLMNSWSTPLTGTYYSESISKNLGKLFPQMPLADIKPGQKSGEATMEKTYSSFITVAVCKTVVDPANGKITISIAESFFGSLLNEKDPQTGRSLYIGSIINENSKYIEFYKNTFVKNPYGDDPLQVRIPQIYINNSAELKAAADISAIDLSLYDATDSQNVFVPEDYIRTASSGTAFTFEQFCELYDAAETEGSRFYYAKESFENFVRKLTMVAGAGTMPANGSELLKRRNEFEQYYIDYFMDADKDNYMNPALVILPSDFTDNLQHYSYNKLLKDLNYKANIFIFDKTNTCFYNNHPVCYFSSFSRKDAQKVIANTTDIASTAGTVVNVAKNFLVDMDRCIKWIKNIDQIPIYFVVDAGLSTIAQFCDNIVWDYFKKGKAFEPVTGGWITQTYDPDHDQDSEDRQITCIEDVSTWRSVVGKLDEISKEIRKDCMTIIDAPRQLTLDGAAPKIRLSRPANDWQKKVGDKLKYISGINSSYTAGYYNWLRMTDTFTGKAFWLPPTCKIIGNLMYLNIMNLPWLAPAGFSYGVITGIHGVSHNPGYREEDVIYMKSWNYVKQYPIEGFVVDGQKTTLTKNSAFNRINVRTLFLDLERYVYNISKTFKYQVNNQYTRELYVQTIQTKFENYKSRGGVYDYKIVCDSSNNTWETIDANELHATIYIKPARLIEYILVDFVCTKSGANFDQLS